MNQEHFESPEQFPVITVEYILANKELVIDFFGDNRVWYERLLKGGIKFGKTSLDSHDDYDVDIPEPELETDRDLPPLEPNSLTEGRAINVVKFFEEYPDAFTMFKAYVEMSNGQE